MRIQTAENQTAGLTVPRRNPPPDRDTARSWPEQIFQKLRKADIRQVTYVPDAGHARLIELCHAEPVTTVLTTEEEAIGVLSGAWLDGERGVLLIQSSGVDNCINTLSLARVCGFPLLMIVTSGGDWGEVNAWQVPMGQIMASNLRLAGAVVYEVIDPNPGGGECRGGGAHRFQRKPDRRRSSLPAHAWNQVV